MLIRYAPHVTVQVNGKWKDERLMADRKACRKHAQMEPRTWRDVDLNSTWLMMPGDSWERYSNLQQHA